MPVITIEREVLKKNDDIAAENRSRLNGIFTFNILSSPGSGKTSILEKTLGKMAGKFKISVIEGDVQTDNDARRIEKYNVPVVQLNTMGGCHLDALQVKNAFDRLDLSGIDMLIIENVGNLVCPAGYDLGEDLKVVVVSTTEGDDKPSKYPAMFRNSSVMLINKTDLLPYVDFSVDRVKENALKINPGLIFFETSCSDGNGIESWVGWLAGKIAEKKG